MGALVVALIAFTTVALAADRAPGGAPAPSSVQEDEPALDDDAEGVEQEPPLPDEPLEEGPGSPAIPRARVPARPSPPSDEEEEPPAATTGSPVPSGPAAPAGPAQPLSGG